MTVRAEANRLLALAMALIGVGLLIVIMSWWRDPTVVATSLGEDHKLTEAQTQTIDVVKGLNGYLVSMTTLMFSGLGWYLTQRQLSVTIWLQAAFFAAAALLSVSFWYAAMTYAELTAELGQNLIGLVAKHSRVLYYLELEVTTCGVAAVLILVIFADAVTRQKA